MSSPDEDVAADAWTKIWSALAHQETCIQRPSTASVYMRRASVVSFDAMVPVDAAEMCQVDSSG